MTSLYGPRHTRRRRPGESQDPEANQITPEVAEILVDSHSAASLSRASGDFELTRFFFAPTTASASQHPCGSCIICICCRALMTIPGKDIEFDRFP